MNKSTGTIAVTLAAALALAHGARAADMEKVTIAMPAIAFIFSTEYVAKDAGIYQKNGLDVTEQLITGIGAANAVISGSVEFSMSSGVTLTRAAARGQPLIALATTYDRTGFWIVLSKKIADERHFDPKAPLAERGKLLKGLRMAVGAIRAIPHAYLNVIAKAGGLNPETDMVVAGMSPTDQVASLQRGAIDGFSGGPPVVEQAVDGGFGVVVADGNHAPSDPPWLTHVAANVVLARPQTCTDHRSLCEKMGRSVAQANAFMHEHPDQAMALLGKRLNVTDAKVLAEAYKETVDASPTPPVSDAKGLATADDLNVQAGFMKESEKLPDYSKLFTNEYVK
jgi:NitT/TauT family transport system substrate-binding protein